METQAANEMMMELLNKWDPLNYGEGFYETEAVDVVHAVHVLDDRSDLAQKIRAIYEFSFEKWIPVEECLKIADQLLAIKNEAGC